jgi:formylglycine-generating enzyme required for sulfatase activity
MKSEVTVAMYRACVAAGRCGEPAGADRACNWGKPGREDHPMNCVAWSQARDFCAAARARLPSEAEWEFAASGGEARRYPWGDEAVDAGGVYRANYNGCDYQQRSSRTLGRRGRDGHEETAPVCSYPRGASRHGLCDLAGNVAEWVEDCYHPSYVSAPADGSAWVTACARTAYVQDCNGLESHGLRGGGWHSWAAALRTTYRSNTHPWELGPSVGFRCARPERR